MSRDFNSNNLSDLIERSFYRSKYRKYAHGGIGGLGSKEIKDLDFAERIHYGFIDHANRPVIPISEYITDVNDASVFDFVADSYSLMRLNIKAAVSKGLLPSTGPFASLNSKLSYTNPVLKYGEYLKDILQLYNETHSPTPVGKIIIASYEDYVNNFFKFFFNGESDVPLTLSRWLTSNHSSILDTGLAIKYFDLPYDADQRKVDQLIDNDAFPYFKNLCLNMGFSIIHNNPNIILYDVSSPATEGIRKSYNISNLESLFRNRFIKSSFIDINTLFRYINLYYNKYVQNFPLSRTVKVKCGKTVSEYVELQQVDVLTMPLSDIEQINLYSKIRNKEEGMPFDPNTAKSITKKAIFLLKTVDKLDSLSYIDNRYASQVWNKYNGYHDIKKKLSGKVSTEAQRQQTGGGPFSGGSSY